MFEGDLLERLGDRLSEMLSMRRFPLQDHAQRDDGVGFFLAGQFLDHDRDFESAWHQVQKDVGVGRKRAQFIGAMSDQALDIFRIELAGDENERAFDVDDARPRRNELRHVLNARLLKQVAHFDPFGFEVFRVVRIRFAPNRHLLDHLDTVALESDHFLRVVR